MCSEKTEVKSRIICIHAQIENHRFCGRSTIAGWFCLSIELYSVMHLLRPLKTRDNSALLSLKENLLYEPSIDEEDLVLTLFSLTSCNVRFVENS